MRMLLVVLLALVAIGAGGVWALGALGGAEGPKAVASVKEIPATSIAAAPAAPSPTVAVPTVAVPPAPAKAAATKPAPAPAPAAPAVSAPPAPAPTVAAPPPATPAAAAPPSIEDQLKAKLKQKLGAALPAIPATAASPAPVTALDEAVKTAAAPAAPPAPPPPATTAAPEPVVRTAQAPTAKPATPATVSQPAAVATAMAAAADGAIDAQLKSRKVTYNRPPKTLVLDKGIDLSLIIDATGENQAAERLKDLPGTIVERDVKLSDNVAAELVGRDFDIQLQSAASRQRLSPRIANEWRWRVTPKALGPHTLTLTVYAYPNGSLDGEPIDSYHDDIVVEVKQLDQVIGWAKGVQPLFAVIAAMAGLLSASVAVLRFRSEHKKPKAPAA
jgi:hypothetical protein